MKKFNRIAALLLVAAMFISFGVPAYAEDVVMNGIADYDISNALSGKVDPNAPDNTIENGEVFNVKLSYQFDNSDTLSTDNVYKYTLPKGFVLYDSTLTSTTVSNGEITKVGNGQCGTYSFSFDSSTGCSTVEVRFDSNFVNATDGRNAELNLIGKFDTDLANNGNDQIEVPGEGTYDIHTPVEQKNYEMSLKKEGEIRRINGEIYIDYIVYVTANDGNLTNVVVTDSPDNPSRVTFQSPAYVSEGENGARTEIATTQANGEYQWTIPSIPDGSTYCIHYTVKVVSKDSSSFYNYVSAINDQNTSGNASTTVSLDTPLVTKSGSAEGSKVTWTINVTFKDYDTVRISELPSGVSGSDTTDIMSETKQNPTVYITYSDGRTVTSDYNTLVGDGYILVSNGTATSATVTFDMILPNDWTTNNNNVDNAIHYYYGKEHGIAYGSSDVEKPDRVVSKTGTALATTLSNNAGGGPTRIRWEVALNFEAAPSEIYDDPLFADVLYYTHPDSDLSAMNLNYDPESFRLVYDGVTYDASTNFNGYVSLWETGVVQKDDWIHKAGWEDGLYSLQNAAYGYKMFQIRFSEGAPKGVYTLIYEATYEPALYPNAYGSSVYVENYFIATDYQYQKETVSVPVNYISKSHDSAKSSEDIVTWRIDIFSDNGLYYWGMESEYPNETGKDFILRDTLPDAFTVKQVRLCDGYGNEQILTRNDNPSESDRWYYTLNGNELTVVIKNDSSNSLLGYHGYFSNSTYLEIVTSYDDYDSLYPGKKSKEFVNKAQLTLNGITYPEVMASATITPPAFISKTMEYKAENAPRPLYTITVNPKAIDMKSDSDVITVVDTIEGPQTIVPGTLTVNGQPYTNYDLNDDATVLTINGLADKTTYTITYRTVVLKEWGTSERFTLKNTAVLKGVFRDYDGDGVVEPNEEVFATSSKTTTAIQPAGLADYQNIRPAVHVTKTDAATNALLPGAVFEIKDPSGKVVGEITSGTDGITDAFSVPEDNIVYTMTEKTAPEGYVIDATVEIKFGRFTSGYTVPDGVDNLYGNAYMYYSVTNTKGVSTTSLTIKKSGGASDENFIMKVTGPELDMQVVVPANGSVTIDGLKVGEEYSVTEDSKWAWRYNIGNPEPITLVADAEENEVTVTNTLNISKWLSGDSVAENRWTIGRIR